ncbi:MAG: SMP-30/gluconolactonase/LRE family protein [Solirubrobacteraceae bacterium]
MDQPQLLMTGIAFGESPRWHDDRLWFADWSAEELIAVDLRGRSEVVARVHSFPFCLDWLPSGELLIVSGAERRLLKLERDQAFSTYADLKPISDKGWNEIVIDGRANAYVNGGGFDLKAGEPFAPGVIALVTPDGVARQVADGIAFPNGMAVMPDNSTLVVAESYAARLTAFEIGADGALFNRRVWAELSGAAPDGICIDASGAVWYADVPNKRCVRVREGGEVLDQVELDRGCFSCALGGPVGSTLFIVAREWRGLDAVEDELRTGQILIVEAPEPGAGWP